MASKTKHVGHRHRMQQAGFQGVGVTDFSNPTPPEIVDFEIFKGGNKCEKVIWQPGGEENVQFILSTEPLGEHQALGLKITPTKPAEQRMASETRGDLDSLISITPLSIEDARVVKERILDTKPGEKIREALRRIELK